MQNAKDTFYEMLRGRLAALNPGRTIVLRGVVRPGVLVEENELVSTVVLPDCFRVNWTQAAAPSSLSESWTPPVLGLGNPSRQSALAPYTH